MSIELRTLEPLRADCNILRASLMKPGWPWPDVTMDLIGKTPWVERTYARLTGMAHGVIPVDGVFWLNFTNQVASSLVWQDRLEAFGVRMPSPAEAFEQVKIPA